MIRKLRAEYTEFKLLINSVPPLMLILFVTSVFSMNLLAHKSLTLHSEFFALDCGIIVSWLTFLSMDIITTHFGPKASTEISIFTTLLNLIFCIVFYIGSKIPGVWDESFVSTGGSLVNHALDQTFGNTWYVITGSTAAFVISAFINNFSNFAVGKFFKQNPNCFFAYFTRTYVSTALGQFADNLTFALLVSHAFFGWTLTQCIVCAITGMLVELICEAIFSFWGFKICENWRKNDIGKNYINYRNSLKEV